MAKLFFPDDRNDEESDNVVVCTGDNIDFGSSEADAIIEVTQMDHTGEYVAMCPYGFTLNLEEAKALRTLIDDAIRQAELAKELQ